MRDTNLVNALREHAEWAQANEWETPITLGDDLAKAADRIANQSTHIAALQQEIEKLRGQLPRWISVEERLPDQCMDIFVCYRDKHILMGTALDDDWIEEDFEYGQITHWMPLPEPPEVENAETQ